MFLSEYCTADEIVVRKQKERASRRANNCTWTNGTARRLCCLSRLRTGFFFVPYLSLAHVLRACSVIPQSIWIEGD
jgi:hypothetical protein